MKQEKQQDYNLQSKNDLEKEIEEKLKNQQEKLEKDLDPYKIDKLAGMPSWIIVFIVKWWFAGAMYYFAWMGIFAVSTDGSTETLIGGVMLGAAMDILVNRIIRFLEREEGAHEKYILVGSKKYYSFVMNMVYCLAVSFFITYGIGGLVGWIATLLGHEGLQVGLGPIIFGLLFYLVDLVCLKIKQIIVNKKTLRRSDKNEG